MGNCLNIDYVRDFLEQAGKQKNAQIRIFFSLFGNHIYGISTLSKRSWLTFDVVQEKYQSAR